MSLTAAVEVLYWIFLKPFGFEKQECEKCKEKFIHHYDSHISKKIVQWVQIISFAMFLIFASYEFYLLADKAYNPPQAEELRNQVTETKSSIFDFLF